MGAIAPVPTGTMLKVPRVCPAASWASYETPEKVGMPLVIAPGAEAVLHQLLLSLVPRGFIDEWGHRDGDMLVVRMAIEIGSLVGRVGQDSVDRQGGCHWTAPLAVGTPSSVNSLATAQVLRLSSTSSWNIRRTTAA